MPILDNLWIIPLLPLLGSAINGLFGGKWTNNVVNYVAVGSTGLSFACALEAVREFSQLTPQQIPFVKQFFTWIAAGTFRAGFDLQVDQLTVVMLLVVTGVGLLIHIYSTGYMAHEGGYYRFFSYLNLFMFFMLILVLAANYSLLFVGWEGVGLCSYLADRLLLPQEVRCGRRQESVHRQSHRRLRLHARNVPALQNLWHARLRADVRESGPDARRRHGANGHPHRRLPAALRRRYRQIRAASAYMSGCRTPWKARRRSAP